MPTVIALLHHQTSTELGELGELGVPSWIPGLLNQLQLILFSCYSTLLFHLL